MMQCGKCWAFKTRPSVLVGHIKRAVGCVSGVVPDDQNLIFEGMRMDDNQKLSDHGITDGAALDLLAHLTGGEAICVAILALAACSSNACSITSAGSWV